jgi:hypothetical protein
MAFDSLLPVFAVSAALFALGVLAMAVGVLFKRPCLRGSCGGAAARGPDGEKLSCADCPNRRRGTT